MVTTQSAYPTQEELFSPQTQALAINSALSILENSKALTPGQVTQVLNRGQFEILVQQLARLGARSTKEEAVRYLGLEDSGERASVLTFPLLISKSDLRHVKPGVTALVNYDVWSADVMSIVKSSDADSSVVADALLRSVRVSSAHHFIEQRAKHWSTNSELKDRDLSSKNLKKFLEELRLTLHPPDEYPRMVKRVLSAQKLEQQSDSEFYLYFEDLLVSLGIVLDDQILEQVIFKVILLERLSESARQVVYSSASVDPRKISWDLIKEAAMRSSASASLIKSRGPRLRAVKFHEKKEEHFTCHYCKQEGHKVARCPKLRERGKSSEEPRESEDQKVKQESSKSTSSAPIKVKSLHLSSLNCRLAKQSEVTQLELPWSVGHIAVRVLLDTGADANFISAAKLRELDRTAVVDSVPIAPLEVTVANRGVVFTQLFVKLRLEVRARAKESEKYLRLKLQPLGFFVLEELDSALIIGKPDLIRMRLSLRDNGVKLTIPPSLLYQERKARKILLHSEPAQVLDIQQLKKVRVSVCEVNAAEFSSALSEAVDCGILVCHREDEPLRLCSAMLSNEDGSDIIAGTDQQKEILHRVLEKHQKCFDTTLLQELPPAREHDVQLEIQEDISFQSFTPRFSQEEMNVMRETLNELLEAGKIASVHPGVGVPVLFVRKRDGSLRMCCDFRAVNKVTKTQEFPLPRVDNILDQLGSAKYFSSLDLKQGYHQLRIHPNSTQWTAFNTPYGRYVWKVCPFGLKNAPAAFSQFITSIFQEKLNNGVCVYLDDIVIYSQTFEEHVSLVEWVLAKLEEHRLVLKKEKCAFNCSVLDLLGFEISNGVRRPREDKVKVIENFARPETASQLRSYLSLFAYFKHLIPRFNERAALLQELLTSLGPQAKKTKLPVWTEHHSRVFADLKSAIKEEAKTYLPQFNRAFHIASDASDVAAGGVLFQLDDNNLPFPVAFYSRCFSRKQTCWPIWEKEMAALVWALEQFDVYVRGTQTVYVQSDHKCLERLFSPNCQLSQRQARWVLRVMEYPLKVSYIPGVQNYVADCFSRYAVQESISARDKEEQEVDKNELSLHSVFVSKVSELDVFEKIQQVTPSEETIRDLALHWEQHMGWVDPQGRRYVPDDYRKIIFSLFHEGAMGAHQGEQRTYMRINGSFVWKNMKSDIAQFVKKCIVCRTCKPLNRPASGEMEITDTPREPFERCALDFVKIETSQESSADALLTITCLLTQFRVFIPLNFANSSATVVAKLFIDHFVKRFGFPRILVSDRDPRFLSSFWKELMQLANCKLAFSTSFHPESDGASERTNAIILSALRCLAEEGTTDWVEDLSLLELSLNSTPSSVFKESPYFLVHGKQPHFFVDENYVSVRTEGAEKFRKKMESVWRIARRTMIDKKGREKLYKDQSRTRKTFTEGQKVFVSAFILPRRSKLDRVREGPFQIVRVLGKGAYEVELPSCWKQHRVINQKYLEPAPDEAELANMDIDECNSEQDDVYDIEKFVDLKKDAKHDYLVKVKWLGYPDEESTWEPVKNMLHLKPDLGRLCQKLPSWKTRKFFNWLHRVEKSSGSEF